MRQNNYFIVNKNQIKLREDGGTACVQPGESNATMATLAKDLTKSKNEYPTASSTEVDLQKYDGNPKNDPVSININANSPSDAAEEIQNQKKNPELKKLDPEKIRFNVTYKESIEYKRANSIPFTKKELNEMFQKKLK